MKYPKNIVEMYKELLVVNKDLLDAESRNFYDKYSVIRKLSLNQIDLMEEIEQTCSDYAAESGADKDGSYDPSSIYDDLEKQV